MRPEVLGPKRKRRCRMQGAAPERNEATGRKVSAVVVRYRDGRQFAQVGVDRRRRRRQRRGVVVVRNREMGQCVSG
jgi:hypothetical protein